MFDLFGGVTPILVLALIIGLVEFAKKLGVKDTGSMVLSVILGVVFGAALQVADMYPATAQWIQLIVYCLVFGLAAGGLFDIAKRFVPKAGVTNVSGDLVAEKTVIAKPEADQAVR